MLQENGGACAAKTGKAIIIGTWSADQTIDIKNCPQNPGDTNKVVEALAKMLKAEGYQRQRIRNDYLRFLNMKHLFLTFVCAYDMSAEMKEYGRFKKKVICIDLL